MITETNNQQPTNAFDKATNTVSIGTSPDGKYYYAGTASKVTKPFDPHMKVAESSKLHITGLVHRRSSSCKCVSNHIIIQN